MGNAYCNLATAWCVYRALTNRSAGEDTTPMAKLNHQKRHRPRPVNIRRRRVTLQRAEEQRSKRDLERWRRAS
jgi:hypothetical protein